MREKPEDPEQNISAKKRVCKYCTTVLSIYNKKPYCNFCRHKAPPEISVYDRSRLDGKQKKDPSYEL